MDLPQLKKFLDEKFREYNNPGFISSDPVVIPHQYTLLQDIEISGFWTAVLSWGNRTTILNKARELFSMMGNKPYDFIINHSDNDLKRLVNFRHRTFNATDALAFIHFLKGVYRETDTMESLLNPGAGADTIESGLVRFHRFFAAFPDMPQRTGKHISSPETGSACKRINMFLRWMVRVDPAGIDFGLWKKIRPSQLICPCDTHVHRVARKLGLITRSRPDWMAAMELTSNLKKLDPEDPVKYDFALFGLGIMEKF
ncbi:MAG TPA: TIGR02757 family protein [Cyclobacteriaceae bacterium]|nr:TIGR02757 family protein [Cyclobacteriaceae bacterium]